MAPIILDGLSEEEWRRERQKSLGASDVPALLGLGYADETPVRLYQEKTSSITARREEDEQERLRLGLFLEPYNASKYEAATGRKLAKAPSIVRHPARTWQGASLDFMVGDVRHPVELKAVFAAPGYPWGDAGTDLVPDRVLVQAAQQAGVTGAESVDVSVLFVGHTHRVYVVPCDPELYSVITAAGAEFWRFVEKREPPPEDWSSQYAPEVANRLATVRDGVEVKLTDEDEEAARKYVEYREIIKEAERECDEIKLALRTRLGECGRGLLPGGGYVTHKIVKRAGYTAEPSEYPQVRISLKPRRGDERRIGGD